MGKQAVANFMKDDKRVYDGLSLGFALMLKGKYNIKKAMVDILSVVIPGGGKGTTIVSYFRITVPNTAGYESPAADIQKYIVKDATLDQWTTILATELVKIDNSYSTIKVTDVNAVVRYDNLRNKTGTGPSFASRTNLLAASLVVLLG